MQERLSNVRTLLRRSNEFAEAANSLSTTVKITGAEFDAMVARGAFDGIGPKKIELIRGELRFMNPSGPLHDDLIDFLTRWSVNATNQGAANVRVQCGLICDDNRPEPDILWLLPRRYGRVKPTAKDLLLLIEVSDSSLADDMIRLVWLTVLRISTVLVLSEAVLVIVIDRLACLASWD